MISRWLHQRANERRVGETRNRKSKLEKVKKVEKVVVPERGKKKDINFPCGSLYEGHIIFGFQPVAYPNPLGIDFCVKCDLTK